MSNAIPGYTDPVANKKLILICAIIFASLLVLAGVLSWRNGNRIISGHSDKKFVHHDDSQIAYENALTALNAGPGSRALSGKPHYHYTFNVNLLPSAAKEGFVWEYKPGFFQETFTSAANPSKYSDDIETSLTSQGWNIQGKEAIQAIIMKATYKREQEVARLQSAALDCGEKKYCLEHKREQLTEINDKPLTVHFYLTNKPYVLYLEYELYPLDETARLDARLVYGCSVPSDEYCRR